MVELTEVREGLASVLVPKGEWRKGPNSASVLVFYNPSMEMNRDISVSLLKAVGKKGWTVLDGLAASGIRGIRFALEVGDVRIVMNDWNKNARNLIEKNVVLNGVEVEILQGNLNTLLNERSFDYIDIDPFGSPVRFLDSASRAVRKSGIIAITATDTAVLCGVYPNVCRRRYMAQPAHNWCMHEIGLRILIGSAVRIAARNDVALRPILSYSADHYFRAYFRAEKGAGKADKILEEIGYLAFTEKSWRSGGNTGPLWLGALHDTDVLSKMKVEEFFGTERRMKKMLAIWKGEAEMPVCFYELPYLSSISKKSTPPMEDVMNALRRNGFRATKTHFSPTGIKTDAGAEALMNLMKL